MKEEKKKNNPVWSNSFWKIFQVAQLVKNLHAMQETLVRFLGREDPLEEG